MGRYKRLRKRPFRSIGRVRLRKPSDMGLGQPYRIITLMRKRGSFVVNRIISEILPAALESALQWMLGTSDGETMDDNLDLVVLDSAVVGDVNSVRPEPFKYIETGVFHNGVQNGDPFDISFWAKRVDKLNYHRVLWSIKNLGSGDSGWRIEFSVSNDIFSFYIVNNAAVIINFSPNPGVDTADLHHYRFFSAGGSGRIQLEVDGSFVVQSGVLAVGNYGGSAGKSTTIGDTGSNSAYVDLSHVKINDDDSSKTCNYPLQEGGGDVMFDISSNNNHGQNVGATRTTLDGVPSSNLEDGFSESSLSDYDTFLIAMDATGRSSGTYTTVDTYSAAGVVARDSLVIKLWTLTDGGLA